MDKKTWKHSGPAGISTVTVGVFKDKLEENMFSVLFTIMIPSGETFEKDEDIGFAISLCENATTSGAEIIANSKTGLGQRIILPKDICTEIALFLRKELDYKTAFLTQTGTYKFVRNDATAYGIYNNFSYQQLEWLFDYVTEKEFGITGDLYSRLIATYKDDVKDKMDDKFQCYAESLSKSTNQYCVCKIPSNMVYAEMKNVLATLLKDVIPAAIKAAENIIANCSGLSDKNTKIWEEQYNNIANEGGEGYVPHRVSLETAESAKHFIQECQCVLKQL